MSFLDNLISILLAVILILLFYFYKKNNNYIIKGPDSNIVKNKIIENNNICYKLQPYPVSCGI